MHEPITEQEPTGIVIPDNEAEKVQTEVELIDEECKKSECLIDELQQENNIGNYFSTGTIKLASLQSECNICQQIREYNLQSGDVPITDKAVQVFARKCGIRMNVLFYEGKRNQCFFST